MIQIPDFVLTLFCLTEDLNFDCSNYLPNFTIEKF